MEIFRSPVPLAGKWTRLVPLALDHARGLRDAASDPDIGRYLIPGFGATLADMESLIGFLLEQQNAGRELPFTILFRPDDRPVGMIRFQRIDPTNRSVEIGGVWLGATVAGTPVGVESAYLLLRHAFETEKVHRVAFRADLRDATYQRTVARLGAVREAEFRDDTLLPEGTFRTSVVYGVLASEWPRVRVGLESMLHQEGSP